MLHDLVGEQIECTECGTKYWIIGFEVRTHNKVHTYNLLLTCKNPEEDPDFWKDEFTMLVDVDTLALDDFTGPIKDVKVLH